MGRFSFYFWDWGKVRWGGVGGKSMRSYGRKKNWRYRMIIILNKKWWKGVESDFLHKNEVVETKAVNKWKVHSNLLVYDNVSFIDGGDNMHAVVIEREICVLQHKT